jgi:uncharacterized phage-associated protein
MNDTIVFDLNPQKGVSLLQILLDKINGEYDYKALLKLAFFADRYHIRNYARPIVGDTYYAMKHGPVPSYMKDSIESQDMYGGNIRSVKDSKYKVELINKNIDKTLFSKSDIEAIDFAIDNYGEYGKTVWNIVNLTHAYPEWDQYRKLFEINHNDRVLINYKDFLLNATPNHFEFKKLNFTDPFVPLSDSDRKDLIEEMKEMALLYG